MFPSVINMNNQSDPNYHKDAQRFIKGSKALGLPVKAEGSEIIAGTPKGNRNGILAALGRMKNAVIDKTSDALSYPSRSISDALASTRNKFADDKLQAREVQAGKIKNNSY